ncbi:tyrosine-type recombinase/integrase [Rheinheimera sp. UJ63]|uniref:tyrosine-type recombinase/integrase n=1 Tax=Rheinheimera sp. UJ63 TaxID=2910157 RepID=UPI001F25B6A3|nr:tyrosine-type recombinase/integrase [Rheinheimera sp. UJ63]MCF4010001.1 tyrosine-type recombinase/integrase [Rheinheimera sp. UJ63]
MKKIHLNATKIKAELELSELGDVYDTKLAGFHMRIGKRRVSFRLSYRNTAGKQQVITIGHLGALTPEQARDQATAMLGAVALGQYPQQEKKANKEQAVLLQQQTLDYFLEHHYRAYQARKKSGSQTVQMIERHFERWSNVPMQSLNRNQVESWQLSKEAEGLAHDTIQRVYGALKTMLNYAVKKGVLTDNPLKHVSLEKPPVSFDTDENDTDSRRYLSDAETMAFFSALDLYQEQRRKARVNSRAHGKAHLADLSNLVYVDHVKPWLLLMYYTGFRPGDLFGLRWEHIDLQSGSISKVIEKTAHHQSDTRNFPLSAKATDVLVAWHKQHKQPARGLVFPSAVTGKRMDKKAMQKPWGKIRTLAGLPDSLNLYTLRHNFASQLISKGADLLTVSKLMAHTNIQTTIRHYGHLVQNKAKEYLDCL